MMSYSGLGYDLVIGTPIGNQKISIPLEAMAQAAGTQAANTAWPILQAKINAAVPGLLSQATTAGRKALEAEIPTVFAEAQDMVVNQLWPKLQPKVRSELDYGVAQGKKIGYTIGAGVVVAIFVAALWVKKGK